MVAMYRGRGWKVAVYGREHGVSRTFSVEGPGLPVFDQHFESGDAIVKAKPPAVLKAAAPMRGRTEDLLMAKWRELNR